MMPQQQIDKLNREVALAPEMDFNIENEGGEPITSLRISDGALLKIRTVIRSVRRISDDPVTGEPRYMIQHEVGVRIMEHPGPQQLPIGRPPFQEAPK